MVLAAGVKRGLSLFLGAIVGLFVGALVAAAFNNWYMAAHVRGDDDANVLVSLLLFGFLPGASLLGIWVANRLHKRAVSST
jgi:hypothetical protein